MNIKALSSTGLFAADEFERKTLDEWCDHHLSLLERAAVSLSGQDGKLSFQYRGRATKPTLDAALAQGFVALEQQQYLVLSINEVSRSAFDDIARQLAARTFACIIVYADLKSVNGGTDNHVFVDLERAFFDAGLSKHPAYYELCRPTHLTQQRQMQSGCYFPVTHLLPDYGLDFLLESRDLHMDMLRESGTRSDAHILRYHFAAKQILAKVGRNAKILDACCGMGYGTSVLHSLCDPHSIQSVDIEARAIEYASTAFGHTANIDFIASELLSYLEVLDANSLDAVVIFEGLEHVDSVEDILYQFNRVLKPNGIMISSVPNAWVNEEGIDENPWHKTVFDWNVYRAMLSRYLAIETTMRQIGGRYNAAGRWYKAEPCFDRVSPFENAPDAAEWWIAVCRTRSTPGQVQQASMPQLSFELKEALVELKDPSIKVVSFDIFDTLLARPTLLPEDVFYILEHNLVHSHGELYSSFSAMRMLAEKSARQIAAQKGLGDITFDEIYDCLAELMSLDEVEVEATKKAELSLERKFLKSRPGVKMLYDHALALGKQVIVISDMYLPSEYLQTVLDENGYDQVSKLWVSSEHRIQKRTGLLFKHVLKELGTQNLVAGQILHIGDNKASDIDMAATYGMRTLHTPKATERYSGPRATWPSGPDAPEAKKVNLAFRSFLGSQINATFTDPLLLFERGTVVDRNPYHFGRLRLAPLVYFSMKSFADTCAEASMKRVFFATRDGHVFKEAFRLIVESLGWDIQTEDLDISREVLNLCQCSDAKTACQFLALKVVQQKNENLQDILQTLTGLPPEEVHDLVSQHISLHQQLSLSKPVKEDQLIECCNILKHLWTAIEPLVMSRRETASRYLERKNIDLSCAIWDMGYFHSIAHILNRQDVSFGLSGHIVETTHHQSRVSRSADTFKTEVFFGGVNNAMDQHPFKTSYHALLVELLLSDPSTKSRRHFTSDGHPIVAAETYQIQDYNREALDALHNGVLDGIRNFLGAYQTLMSKTNVSPTEILQYALSTSSVTELLGSHEFVFENNGLHRVGIKGGKLMTQPISGNT